MKILSLVTLFVCLRCFLLWLDLSFGLGGYSILDVMYFLLRINQHFFMMTQIFVQFIPIRLLI